MNGALIGRRLALSFLIVVVLLRRDRFITTLDVIRQCGFSDHVFDHVLMLGTGHADAFQFLRIVRRPSWAPPDATGDRMAAGSDFFRWRGTRACLYS